MTETTGKPRDFEQASGGFAALEEEGGNFLLRRVQHFLHAYPTIVPFIVLLAGTLFFATLVGGKFFAPFNFSLVLQQVTIIGIVGVAQTLIVLTAGIDLSVGAMMVLSSVVMGKFAIDVGLPVPVAFASGLIVGTLCGIVNGLLVTKLRLPPFIVTLGTWSIFFALNLWYSGSESIRSQDIAATAGFLQFTGTPFVIGQARITIGSILMLGLVVLFWYILNWTSFGRHVYAIGDDPEAAKLAGIRTDGLLLSVYAIAGFICAVAGWALIGRIGSVSPQSGYTANLNSITAVVIGGTSLFGGRGSIIGTLDRKST